MAERRPKTKNPARPGSSCSASRRTPEVLIVLLGGQRLDTRGQGALVARGLVAMDDVLVDQRVDHRLGFLERLHGIGLVAGGEGVVDLAQRRAHTRTQRDVTRAVGLSSTGGFFS